MNWNQHIKNLALGQTVQFRPKGNSMSPLINSGDLVTVVPSNEIEKGDIVFCKIKGNYYIHLVKTVDGDRFQIGNNKGKINGWTKVIFGKVINVDT